MELGDAISHPEYVQWVIDNQKAPMGMDCDEHAVYIVAAIKNSLALNNFLDVSVRDVELLTVCWLNKKGEYEGHNVALITNENFSIKYSYMDYGFPSNSRPTVEQLVDDIIHRYGGVGSTSLGWSTQDEKLRVKKVSWK
ncbi:hypothetical protein EBZ38_08445 [bacterium]|nr:hypothetical protein [bacterium]